MPGKTDKYYMRLALALAGLGRGRTGSNPRVGAVAVKNDRIVGIGAHLEFGKAHAERHLIDSTRKRDLRGATLYLTLEPCSHTGKQPPCAPAIVEAGFGRVVTAIGDPNPLVNGGGFAALRKSGLDLDTALCSGSAACLNAPFICLLNNRRSFVTLKVATGYDGRLAARDGSSQWITGPPARQLVHQWRNGVDAILIGRGTFESDRPGLNVRLKNLPRKKLRQILGRRLEIELNQPGQPARVVVDSGAATALALDHFSSDRTKSGGRWIIACNDDADTKRVAALRGAGIECWLFDRCKGARGIPLTALLSRLAENGLIDVMVEGGAALATELIRCNLVDCFKLFFAPVFPGGDRLWLGDPGYDSLNDAPRPVVHRVRRIGDDVLVNAYSREMADLLENWQASVSKPGEGE